MAKISTYATTAPALGDMLIGTDVNDMNSTKNFTIGSLLSLPGSTAYVPYTGALYNVDLGANDITAFAFLVPGGLGTDFLKADGSLDNTAYLPVSTAATTYVPYTGATGNVDLGSNRLTATSLRITTDDVEMIGLTPPSAINDYFEIGNWGWSGKSGFLVDFINDRYYLGDRLNAVNGTYILVDDANSRVEISKAIYTNASTGTSGQILTSQGAALPATWVTPAYLVPTYGSFYDVVTQTTTGASFELMKFGTNDIVSGVTITNDTFGDPTKITFSATGVYNIQFSAQLKKTGGGGATIFYIYLIKDGTAVPNSTTAVTLENNGDLAVAAWNWFIDIPSLPSNCQIGWYANNANGELHYDAAPVVGIPAIPSVILTVNRIS
jgi:hypothetical protein